jgi:zinc transport system ATP-binding protein
VGISNNASSQSSSDLAVEMRDVCFSYGDHPVLSHVDLSVERRDFMAVLGPNGGGKTTLLKLILGLASPCGGSIRVFGQAPSHSRGRVGYVPQVTTSAEEFPATVLDVVLMGRLGFRGRRSTKEERARSRHLLSTLGIEQLAKRGIATLSGGQRQRVLIARALAGEPELLLLDEPVASVDPASQEGIYGILDTLNRDHGVTIVMVTHDVGAVSSHVSSIACMNVGLFTHGEKLMPADVAKAYGCPIDLVSHGVPHRVLLDHDGEVREG